MSEAQQAAERAAFHLFKKWDIPRPPTKEIILSEFSPLLAAMDAELTEAREIIAELLKPWDSRDPNAYARASDFLRRIEDET